MKKHINIYSFIYIIYLHKMNPQEKIDLKKLVTNMPEEYVDNTEGIRALKHSRLIHADILKMDNFKQTNA